MSSIEAGIAAGVLSVALSLGVSAAAEPSAHPARADGPAPTIAQAGDEPGDTCSDNAVNCAYDPARLPTTSVIIGNSRELGRRQGPAPAPGSLQALVAVQIVSLVPADQRWTLKIDIVSQATKIINPSVSCQFQNAGRRVVDMTYAASSVPPGQIVTVEMAGPSIQQVYVDGAECRVLGPLR